MTLMAAKTGSNISDILVVYVFYADKLYIMLACGLQWLLDYAIATVHIVPLFLFQLNIYALYLSLITNCIVPLWF